MTGRSADSESIPGTPIGEIARRLDAIYGPRKWRRHGSAIDELIATVLSQHTSDANTDRAFRSLKERFPTWHDVIKASTDELAATIRSGGLANQKAPRIQAMIRAILAERGSLDLDWLAALPVSAARAALTRLPGVGPKTASCVLLFSLGMPAMPVDTHVHRVTRRLGLIPPSMTAEAAHEVLEEQLGTDRDKLYAFHLNVIEHGRTVCLARRPRCECCLLSDCCDYYRQQTDDDPPPSSPPRRRRDDALPGPSRSHGWQRQAAIARLD